MKLVLSSNRSEKYKSFHDDIQQTEKVYEYFGYNSLLFILKSGEVDFITIPNGKHATDYEAVYLTSYLSRTEPAVAAATVLDSAGVRYVDSQVGKALSTSKLTEYARLAAAGVSIPRTIAGSARAIIASENLISETFTYPLILKRADADRGIDNYIIASSKRLLEIVSSKSLLTLWIVQEFIPNDGFYRLSFYNGVLTTAVFRANYERDDHNAEKQHLNKPASGVNASLIEIDTLPKELINQAINGCEVMKRQFAGVDVLIDRRNNKPYVLEVNYNPQLVTISAFRDLRADAFLDAMKKL